MPLSLLVLLLVGQAPPDPVRVAVEKSVAAGAIPGAVVYVAQAGKPLRHEAIGVADAGRPLAADALFRIASMTKPVTSAAVLRLVEDGKLSLDDPVARYIPGFATATVYTPAGPVPPTRPVTVRDLLTHTSGVAYGLTPPEPLKKNFAAADLADGLNANDPTLEANAAAVARIPLVHQPGTAWTYGMNTDLLGRVVEVAAGVPFDRYLAERFFGPLRMADTGFRVPTLKMGRLVALYAPGDDKRVRPVPTDPFTSGGTVVSPKRVLGPSRYVSGGAGLVSTAADYARFAQMLLNEGELDGVRVLAADSVRAMTRNQIGELNLGFAVHGDKFGFGVGVVTKPGGPMPVGSYSWGGMYHTLFWVDPSRKLVAVVMTQVWPWGTSTLWPDFQKALAAVPRAKE